MGTIKRLEIFCCVPKEQNTVFRAHLLKAVADISSELKISGELASIKLLDTNIDNPIVLSDVEYWVEEVDVN